MRALRRVADAQASGERRVGSVYVNVAVALVVLAFWCMGREEGGSWGGAEQALLGSTSRCRRSGRVVTRAFGVAKRWVVVRLLGPL